MKKHEALNCKLVCEINPRHLDALFHRVELAQIGQHKKAIKIFDALRQKKTMLM